ncbi:Sulfate permease, MFS superfamily [Mesorhizobium albiziae]|uniref:Sulfate permease, MFS superfamily n=1 Tax=Neomesorhizobium albiziae TaxID=335020 RepID=A0A1I3WLW4_9HYPH|nr:SulP family inorganic anion transporter [Mesorhizobium albiziae]GLS31708.1 sulfate transporter [Mesorhizobium albiziae]SFK08123.1 Sulfate permease, MFS superfamily [Mesorhizobium albiziae]
MKLPIAPQFGRDFTASIVVLLVALPLCMGIAIASGVPAEKGLITGIVGGLVVGMLAGSPLQVSGPAAGLAVVVFQIVRDFGLTGLAVILTLAGLIQLIAGVLRLGGWFRAISPSVVHGMLAGIGVLIVVSQLQILFGHKPQPSGIENLLELPLDLLGLMAGKLSSSSGSVVATLCVGLLTIIGMLGWERLRPAALKPVPGALVGVLAATVLVSAAGLGVETINVPASILSTLSLPDAAGFVQMLSPAVVIMALALAFIASAETLLSAAAVDRMHDGVRTDYDKELRAQGIGNFLCGILGAIPMTGVIVRSSANVQAGAATRLSTILHGAWILALVVLFPGLLSLIPMASLAGVLVVTGWRLVDVNHVTHLKKAYGLLPALIWSATLIAVVVADLLTGVLVGIALSLVELIPHRRRLSLRIDEEQRDGKHEIALIGRATFITLPKLYRVFDAIPASASLKLDLERLTHIDHSCAEMLRDWVQRRKARGASTHLVGGEDRIALHSAT